MLTHGEKIKIYLKKNNIKQKDVAAFFNTTQGAISNILSKGTFNESEKAKFTDFLKIDESFFDNTDENRLTSNRKKNEVVPKSFHEQMLKMKDDVIASREGEIQTRDKLITEKENQIALLKKNEQLYERVIKVLETQIAELEKR